MDPLNKANPTLGHLDTPPCKSFYLDIFLIYEYKIMTLTYDIEKTCIMNRVALGDRLQITDYSSR